MKKHNEKKFIVPQLTILSILSCEIFKSLDKSELLRYIEIKRKVTHAVAVHISNRTHGFISVLSNLYDVLIAKFNLCLTETSKHSTSFSRNLQAFMREFANFHVLLELELGGDPIQNKHYKAILDLISSEIMPHYNDGEYDVFKLQSDFFLPVLKILSELRLDERSKPLALAANSCLNDVKGISMEKGYLSENIETVITKYNEQAKEIKKVVQDIEG